MTPETAAQIAQDITRRVHFDYGDGWRGFDAYGETEWSNTIQDLMVALIGERPIEYVSGHVGQDGDRLVTGEIIVFTAHTFVRATFTAGAGGSIGGAFRLQSKRVWSARRDTIKSVEALNISRTLYGEDVSAWPAWSSYRLTFDDGESVVLPVKQGPAQEHDASLTSFVATLLE